MTCNDPTANPFFKIELVAGRRLQKEDEMNKELFSFTTEEVAVVAAKIVASLPEQATVYEYGRLNYTPHVGTTIYEGQEFPLRMLIFEVPDTVQGIRTVADALGYGMPHASYGDDCVDVYRRLEMRNVTRDLVRFNGPVLFLSHESFGYRATWGGAKEAFVCYYNLCEEEGWTTDYYELRPGLSDGGIVVQSSSTTAAIMAEKKGSIWTLSLISPIINGEAIGRSYESSFRGAFNWYKRQVNI